CPQGARSSTDPDRPFRAVDSRSYGRRVRTMLRGDPRPSISDTAVQRLRAALGAPDPAERQSAVDESTLDGSVAGRHRAALATGALARPLWLRRLGDRWT